MSRMNMAPGRPLSNPKLRKILAECINLQDMEKPLRGYVVCNPNYSRYTKSNRIYNPVKADKPVTLKMVFYESRPEFKIIAEATQLQAKKAGIDIKLQSVHVNALRDVRAVLWRIITVCISTAKARRIIPDTTILLSTMQKPCRRCRTSSTKIMRSSCMATRCTTV